MASPIYISQSSAIESRAQGRWHIAVLYFFVSGMGIDDQHRNTNMNDKDHLVGQLTTIAHEGTKEVVELSC